MGAFDAWDEAAPGMNGIFSDWDKATQKQRQGQLPAAQQPNSVPEGVYVNPAELRQAARRSQPAENITLELTPHGTTDGQRQFNFQPMKPANIQNPPIQGLGTRPTP